jgi:quercetin dioxygenase-like cupin family protein
MNRFFLSLVAGSLAATPAHRAVSTAAAAESEKAPMMVSFAELKWRELPERKGTQFAVLSGDPRGGQYTQMRRVPGGTDNPLHVHSSEITNVVVSGVLYMGADAASAKDLGPGSVVMLPANWVHVSGCRAGSDCVFYQEGKGKFDYKPIPASK